ncbi:MAG: hypothetical protein Q9187_006183 [Circinaria calcarea]
MEAFQVKYCRECRTSTSTVEDIILSCAACEEAYHRRCCTSHIADDAQWICERCKTLESRIIRVLSIDQVNGFPHQEHSPSRKRARHNEASYYSKNPHVKNLQNLPQNLKYEGAILRLKWRLQWNNADSEKEVQGLKNQMQIMSRDTASLRRELDRKTGILKENNDLISWLKTRMTEGSNSPSPLEKTVDEQAATVNGLKKELADQAASITRLTGAVTEKDNAISTFQKEAARRDASIAALETRAEGHGFICDDLQRQKERLQLKEDELHRWGEALEQSKTELVAQLTERRQLSNVLTQGLGQSISRLLKGPTG